MSERPSAEPIPQGSASSHPDQAAKIEQLLLSGLDAYFAGQYDLAIGIWTRVLFLDRAHARARAYIDRARRALAERHRESEELLHEGVEAFRRGDRGEARRLLELALVRGAPPEEARTVLDRLHEVETAASPFLGDVDASRSRREEAPSPPDSVGGRRWPLAAAGGALLALGLLALIGSGRLGSWFGIQTAVDVAGRSAVQAGRVRPLELPRLGALALARARTQVSAGHVRDALATLAEVRRSDPASAEVDRYRAELQRQLLALAPTLPGVSVGASHP